MAILKFLDDTPPLKCTILLKAESILLVKDGKYFFIVNRMRVDEDRTEERVQD
jgi:hypothetical protein